MPNSNLMGPPPGGRAVVKPLVQEGEHEGVEKLDVFFALADAWNLTAEQQITLLGSPGRSTFFRWKKHDGGSISADTVERISNLLAIYKGLEIMLPANPSADQWVNKPNAYFDGRSALEVMLEGRMEDILVVRRYVDAQRG